MTVTHSILIVEKRKKEIRGRPGSSRMNMQRTHTQVENYSEPLQSMGPAPTSIITRPTVLPLAAMSKKTLGLAMVLFSLGDGVRVEVFCLARTVGVVLEWRRGRKAPARPYKTLVVGGPAEACSQSARRAQLSDFSNS